MVPIGKVITYKMLLSPSRLLRNICVTDNYGYVYTVYDYLFGILALKVILGRLLVIYLVEDLNVTVKCRTTVKALFLYFDLCLSVYHVHLHPYHFLLNSISLIRFPPPIELTAKI